MEKLDLILAATAVARSCIGLMEEPLEAFANEVWGFSKEKNLASLVLCFLCVFCLFGSIFRSCICLYLFDFVCL